MKHGEMDYGKKGDMKYGNAHNKQNCTNQKGEAHPEQQPTVMSSDAGYVMNSNDEHGTGPMGTNIVGSGTSTGMKETQPGTHAYG